MVKKRIFSGILLLLFILTFVGSVHAQITPMPSDAPGVSAWRFDPVTTEVGKRAERARQFVNWILTHPSIDNHAVFRQVWLVSSGVTFFLILLTVILMGIGVLVARKRDISLKVDITPIIWKVVLLLVYTAFSYWIVLGLIQASDILMQFFIKLLNADKLFRIFFAATSEEGYRNFVGYRDFDPLKIEMVKTSWFVIDVSSYTYFVMGIVVVLRKIVLWFLLIVAPFLALLMPFRLIRNTGWIWIGVFFQWAFYGPLFALFLGALTSIWAAGIPFRFNFWRIRNGTATNAADKIVYPLSINILYGGPQQAPPPALGSPLSATEGSINTSNYVDTFAEYVISLVMLWVVMILPWWLLRIFRDYCCEGIYAMKNILLNMLEQQSHGPSPGPIGPAAVPKSSFSQQRPIPTSQQMREEAKASAAMENMKDIKAMDVSEITRRMDIQIEKLSDIARFETKSDRREYVKEVMEKMRNPMAAENKEERAQFSKLKTELSERAVKGDMNAQRFLNATTSTNASVRQAISTFAQSKAQTVTNIQNISQTLNISQQDVKNITQSMVSEVVSNKQAVTSIANNAQVSESQAAQVLQSVPKAVEQVKPSEVVKSVAQTAGVSTDKTTKILEKAAQKVQTEEIARQVAQKSNAKVEQVKRVAQEVLAKPITQKAVAPAELIARPASMSIDEYEEIKKMWTDHYQKGEIPVSDTVKTRKDWVQKDIVSLNNTLNKLISDNEEIRAEGLQEVSDVIPFFMLGNMNMQDIATYLKAKVSAAQDIQTRMGEVEAAQQEAGAKIEEQFIDVERTAEVAKEQTMHLEEEIKASEEKSRESRVASQDVSNYDESRVGDVIAGLGHQSQGVAPATVVINQGVSRQQFEGFLKRMDIQISKLSDIVRAQTEIAKASATDTTKATEYSNLVTQSSQAVSEKITQLSRQDLALVNTAQSVATDTKSDVSQVQRLIEQWTSMVTADTQLLTKISDSAHVTSTQVSQVLTALSAVAPVAVPRDMLTTISDKTSIDREKVSSVVEKTREAATSKEQLAKLAEKEHISDEHLKEIVEKVSSTVVSESVSTDKTVPTLQLLAADAGTKSETLLSQLQTAVSSFTSNVQTVQSVAQSLAVPVAAVNAIATAVPAVLSTKNPAEVIPALVSQTNNSKEVVEKVVEKLVERTSQTTTIKEVQQTMQGMMPKALDARAKRAVGKGAGLKSKVLDSSQMIAVPKTMSIDEYEEIKKMWIEHYTNGEVPITAEIKTRLDWVQHDSVLLSNVLNKLVSQNEEIKAAGLAVVSDIIPFFMLTDMTIQDIAMYLKAKLSAAKEVYEDLLKEEELKKMLEQKTEEFVEVGAPASTTGNQTVPGADKTQAQEMKIEDSSKDKQQS